MRIRVFLSVMIAREEVRKRLLLYCCCVLVYSCVVMLGSQLTVTPWVVDLLVLPPVRILLWFADSPAVLRLFALFPHFGSRALPILYGLVLFSPLIGYSFSAKKAWLYVQGFFALIHMALYVLSL